MKQHEIKVKVRFSSYLREYIGEKEVEIKLNEELTINDLMSILRSKWPIIGKMDIHGEGPIIIMHNNKPASRETKLINGDEIVLLPPATGG